MAAALCGPDCAFDEFDVAYSCIVSSMYSTVGVVYST